jgi:hypothetical protein
MPNKKLKKLKNNKNLEKKKKVWKKKGWPRATPMTNLKVVRQNEGGWNHSQEPDHPHLA